MSSRESRAPEGQPRAETTLDFDRLADRIVVQTEHLNNPRDAIATILRAAFLARPTPPAAPQEALDPDQARIVREALQESFVQGFTIGWDEGHRLTVLQGQNARSPTERHIKDNEFPHSPIASATREVADEFRAALQRPAAPEEPVAPLYWSACIRSLLLYSDHQPDCHMKADDGEASGECSCGLQANRHAAYQLLRRV